MKTKKIDGVVACGVWCGGINKNGGEGGLCWRVFHTTRTRRFGDGGVAWKTAVVMVLGCAVGGDKREKRGGVVMIIMKGLGLGCGYYT